MSTQVIATEDVSAIRNVGLRFAGETSASIKKGVEVIYELAQKTGSKNFIATAESLKEIGLATASQMETIGENACKLAKHYTDLQEVLGN